MDTTLLLNAVLFGLAFKSITGPEERMLSPCTPAAMYVTEANSEETELHLIFGILVNAYTHARTHIKTIHLRRTMPKLQLDSQSIVSAILVQET